MLNSTYYNQYRKISKYAYANYIRKRYVTSSSLSKLPVVDVEALTRASSKNNTNEIRNVGLDLDKAFRESGFCYIKNHNIDVKLLNTVLSESRRFFMKPQEEKNKISLYTNDTTTVPVRGYQAIKENVTLGSPDLHEGIDFYCEKFPKTFEDSPLKGKNLYPDLKFEKTINLYINEMLNLGRSMIKGLNTIRPDITLDMFEESFWVMRSIYYPYQSIQKKEEEGLIGCGEHTDYGFFTFVHADNVPGCLQVKDKDNIWHDVKPIEGTFVCNIGDMLALATNGTYRSTPHRVLPPVGNDRISVPFFFEPNFDWVGENSVLYGKHLEQRVLSNFSQSPYVKEENKARKIVANV